MINIKILKSEQADQSFGKVVLTTAKLPDAFIEGTNSFANSQGGFDIILDIKDKRCFQKAGRTVGALGFNKVVVSLDDSVELKLDTITATEFILGMYSEVLARKGMKVALDLDDATLASVQRDVEFITLGRIFANSPNNQYHTVDLVDTYCQELIEAFKRHNGKGSLTYKIYKKGDQLFDQECIGLQAVGNSSTHQPCLGVLEYIGPNADPNSVDFALVGKGIAFDTGGNNIKPTQYMETMRTDKSGLVYVAAATALAGAMSPDKHIVCYLPCAENMVSGSAMVPGDILTYPNKVTVEIANTDAEGRLILADALLQAAKLNPKFLLDAATLTGAAKIAVGRDMCAILSRTNSVDEQLAAAYNYTHEEYWCLPMKEYHKRYITARRADIANSSHGDGAPGASTAAAFLSFFVKPEQAWTHLDLSNAYQSDNSPYFAPGSTGSNIYALAHWMVGAHY